MATGILQREIGDSPSEGFLTSSAEELLEERTSWSSQIGSDLREPIVQLVLYESNTVQPEKTCNRAQDKIHRALHQSSQCVGFRSGASLRAPHVYWRPQVNMWPSIRPVDFRQLCIPVCTSAHSDHTLISKETLM
ncbi:unnamed protein product [Boreogadus saida]